MKTEIRENYEFVTFEKDGNEHIGLLLDNINSIGYDPECHIHENDITFKGEKSEIKLIGVSEQLISVLKSQDIIFILSIDTDELIPCK